jgi:hypothetical protein
MSRHDKHYIKLEVVYAYLWKFSIHSKDINNYINYSIGMEIDGCTYLTNMRLSSNYFGNVLS